MTLENKAGTFEIDIKSVSDDGTFEGYASVFGVKDGGNDIVMPGAFTKSLVERPASQVKMLWQHDRTEPIGTWSKFEEDGRGLKASGKLILETRKGAEVHALLKARAVDGLSIGYRTVRGEQDRTKSARLLHELKLMEVSVVTFPMSDESRISSVKQSGPDYSSLVAAINATTKSIKGN